jgi:clan AA aspartic protease (TIGR02281 family)
MQYEKGETMMKAVLVSFMFIVSLAHAFEQPNTAAVAMELRLNLIVVTVGVNGVPKKFILDTGASHTVISDKLAQELGLTEVEKSKARGAGGEIDVSIVRVDSFSIGTLVVKDLSCTVASAKEMSSMLGEDISGVLGYNVLSQFTITVDYEARRLTFVQYEKEELETAVINGDYFTSPKFKVKLERPNQMWSFVTETPLPDMLVILEKPGSSARVTVSARELHGIELKDLAPLLDMSLPAQVESYENVSAATATVAGYECYVVEYKGKKDGVDQSFRLYSFKPGEVLYTVKCSADEAEFVVVSPQFSEIANSVQFLPGSGN